MTCPVRPSLWLTTLGLSSLTAFSAHAAVDFDTSGGTYTQDFDTLASSGFANTWTNDTTLPGWYIFSSQSISGATGRRATAPDDVAPASWVAVDTYTAANAAPTRSRVYSFGANGSGERALGGYTTASGNPASDQINAGDNIYALALQNTTGGTLTDATITYTGEQWQGTFNPGSDGALVFSYLVKDGFNAQTDIPTQNTYAPYTLDSDLDFRVLQDATLNDQPLDGNAAANRTTLSDTLTGLAWNEGEYLILRWIDNDISGNDFGLAIDDFSLTATGPAPIPEPASAALFAVAVVGVLSRRRRR